MAAAAARPHAVVIPCPFRGHTTPFLHLSKLLASQGFAITYLTTPRSQPDSQHIHLLHTQGLDIRLRIVPDGLPPDYLLCITDIPTYLHHFEALRWPVEALMENIMADRSPPVTCILSDSHLGWTQDVANKFNLPRICFLTSSTTEYVILVHQPVLLSMGLLPFKGANGTSAEDSASVISCIPGLPPIHRTEFPSFLQVEDSSDYEFQYFMRQARRIVEVERLLVASFDELEAPTINALRERMNVQPIGPIVLLEGNDPVAAKTGTRPSADEERCLRWLDSQEPSSVLYMAFGTLANLSVDEVREIALALEETQQPFLWALRPDAVVGVEDPFPEGFRERNSKQGLIMSWAPQLKVLSHRSVGGFLTHCGWGSTLESICMGVPLLCWPLYGDQLLNCKLLVDGFQAGVKVKREQNGKVKSEEIARAMVGLMKGKEGEAARERMSKLKEAARKTTAKGGSSYKNFQTFVDDMVKRAQQNN